MADVARCLCPKTECPIHGTVTSTPKIAWNLSTQDRAWLIRHGIGPGDIEDARQADEDRFKP